MSNLYNQLSIGTYTRVHAMHINIYARYAMNYDPRHEGLDMSLWWIGGEWLYSECSHAVVGFCPPSLMCITPHKGVHHVLMSCHSRGAGGMAPCPDLWPTPPSYVCNSILIVRGLVVTGGVRAWEVWDVNQRTPHPSCSYGEVTTWAGWSKTFGGSCTHLLVPQVGLWWNYTLVCLWVFYKEG